METQINATVNCPCLGEFVDDALEGVDPRPPADKSEIVKAYFLGEFVDDAAAFPPAPSPVATPKNETLIKE